MEIKDAYLRSGPITREIYARTPRECNLPQAKLWLMRKLPYGVNEAGIQLEKVLAHWLFRLAGF